MTAKETLIGHNGGPPMSHLLNAREVADYIGVSLSTLWRGVAQGSLPPPFYPSPGCPRWSPEKIREAVEATSKLPVEAKAMRSAARVARTAGHPSPPLCAGHPATGPLLK